MATKRLNLDTQELRDSKRLEVIEWLDSHPYEETLDLKVIHAKIHRDIKEQEERTSDTKRVEFIYTGDTVFDQMKEDLLMPYLHEWDRGRPMMRTQLHLYKLVANELMKRHPVLQAKDKSWFLRVLDYLRRLEAKTAEHERQEESKPEGYYKNVDLKSPAHQLICEELERRKIMFMWEVNTVLPGDTKSFRRIDLVVIQNFRAVIVEIDGKSHRSQQQYQDDVNRDRLIGDHWNNQIRLEYGEVMDDFRENEGETVMRKILSRVDPNNGLIR